MKVAKVCCQGCGADLEVDESIRFVTCNFCGSRLEIVHDPTTTHSRLLEEIGEKTDRMSQDLGVIRLQNDLEQLDREWALEREGMMTTSKDGTRSKPSAAGSVIGGVVAAGFGIFWIGMASSMGAPGAFPAFGVIFIIAAIAIAIGGVTKAERYQRAESTMRQRREKLMADLDRAKRED